MKRLKFIIFFILCLTGSFGLAHADGGAPAVTLEKIFSKLSSIRTMSYQSRIRAPVSMWSKIWIRGERVYLNMGGIKMKQIGKKSYVYSKNEWKEDPGLTINTVVAFLKQAQEAHDTKIIGQEFYHCEPATIIEYTQPGWEKYSPPGKKEPIMKVRLWISNESLLPIRIYEINVKKMRTQKQDIIHMSLEEFDDKEFEMPLHELLKADRMKAETKTGWERCQEARDKEYSKLREQDQKPDRAPPEKKAMWERFASAILRDNPNTKKDDEMRSFAQSRVLHWKSIKPNPRRFKDTGYEETVRDGTLIAYADGVVADKQTGLEWFVGPDRDTTWDTAKTWVQRLSVDGGGWRMPTVDELRTLYKKGIGEFNISTLFKTSGWFIWSGEEYHNQIVFVFNFKYGVRIRNKHNSARVHRAFAVRSQYGK